MKTYHQLTREQRYQIAALYEAGHTQSEIARVVGVHKSTICRELSRNQATRGYLPRHAHLLALARRKGKARCSLTPQHWEEVHRLLRLDWSPEQIARRAQAEGAFRISPEWIYQHLLADRRRGGDLYQCLRCQRVRRKRYGCAHRMCGAIAGRVGIAERPAIVAARRRLGDWEGDTLAGHRWRIGVLTLIERKSRFTRLARIRNKSAPETANAVTRCLRPLRDAVRTLTVDNGQEFSRHQTIAAQLTPRCILLTHMPLGSVAASKTSTACYASTSQERWISLPSLHHSYARPKTASITARANASATGRPLRYSSTP
jgi:IS30 family transposase